MNVDLEKKLEARLARPLTELEKFVSRSQRLAPQTKRTYLQAISDYHKHAGAAASAWTPASVSAWRDELGKRVEPRSVVLYLRALKYAARRYADEHDDDKLYFARKVEMPFCEEDTRDRRIAIKEADAARMIQACSGALPVGRRDRALLTLGFRTGLRRAGLCAIDLSDLEDVLLTVKLKGRRIHRIKLDDKTMNAIRAWMVARSSLDVRGNALFCAFARNGLTVTKDRLTAEGVYEAVRKRAKQVGLANVSPHVMRHSCISWLVARGVPNYLIRELTGQKSDAIIAIYTHDLEGKAVSGVLPEDIG